MQFQSGYVIFEKKKKKKVKMLVTSCVWCLIFSSHTYASILAVLLDDLHS